MNACVFMGDRVFVCVGVLACAYIQGSKGVRCPLMLPAFTINLGFLSELVAQFEDLGLQVYGEHMNIASKL